VDIVSASTALSFAVVGSNTMAVSAIYTKIGEQFYSPLSPEVLANNFTTLQGYTYDTEELETIPSLITPVSLILNNVTTGTIRHMLMNNNSFNSNVIDVLKRKMKEYYIFNKRFQKKISSLKTIPEGYVKITPSIATEFYQNPLDTSKAFYLDVDGNLQTVLLESYWLGMYNEDILDFGYYNEGMASQYTMSMLVKLPNKSFKVSLTHIVDTYFEPILTNGGDIIQPYFNASSDKVWYHATYDMYVFTSMDFSSPKRFVNANTISASLDYIRGSGKTLLDVLKDGYIVVGDSLVNLSDSSIVTKSMITTSNGWVDLTLNISPESLSKLEEIISGRLQYS
jgi:hypothetical protein